MRLFGPTIVLLTPGLSLHSQSLLIRNRPHFVHSSVVSPFSKNRLPFEKSNKHGLVEVEKSADHANLICSADNGMSTLLKELQSDPKGFLRLDSTIDGERGLFLNNECTEKGAVLLRISMESCLTDRKPPKWFTENVDKDATFSPSSWATRLAASLLDLQLQSRKGNLGKSHSLWLSLLPKSEYLRASLPVHWPDETLTNAKSTALELAADRAYFSRGKAIQDLTFALQNFKLASDLTSEEVSTMVNNALDTVQTRSNRLESTIMKSIVVGPPHRVIAPGLDFINHGSSMSGESSANVEVVLEGVDEGELEVVVRASRDLNSGEELLVDYGDSARPAWRCLLNYGFVPQYRRIPSAGDPPSDERDDENLAELYIDGKRYDVGPSAIPSEMVAAARASTYPLSELGDIRNGQAEVELTADIALRLARRISDVSYLLLLEPERDLLDDHPVPSPFHVLSKKLAASLRWSQHRILLACASGLREYASEESSYL
jgi:hypothetical protein